MPESPSTDTRTPVRLRLRLATLVFGEYAIWGLWFVSLGSWLGATLHFTGQQIGMIYGTLAIAGLCTPMLSGAIADRFARAERMLALLHGTGGVLLILAARQTSFRALYAAILVYALCYLPTLSLVPSLVMRHLVAPAREFPALRSLGTVGWIVAGIVIGALHLELTATPMRLAGAASVVFGAWCLTLPATPPLPQQRPRTIATLAGLDAFALLRDPLFALFLIANVVLGVPSQIYQAFAALYLTELHLPQPATLLAFGQGTEVLVLLMLPRLRSAFGIRQLLLVGAVAWTVRCLLFAIGSGVNTGAVVAGILLHGVAYGCAFVAGQLVVHERAPVHLRASAQGLWALMTMGVGNLAGAWAAGSAVQRNLTGTDTHDWRAIWMTGAAVAALVAVGVLASMRGPRAEARA